MGHKRPIYKQGKLSGRKRFSARVLKPVPIIVTSCVLATFIFAVILGNILGNKADSSRNGSDEQSAVKNELSVPELDMNSEVPKLQAYAAELSEAGDNTSLKDYTGKARELGNAIFFPIKDINGRIVYNSVKTKDLFFDANSGLSLSTVKSHFSLEPADYVCAFWRSELGKGESPDELLDIQSREVSLLSELAVNGVSEILVSFEAEYNKENILSFQTYLLSLRMGAPDALIGVAFDFAFLESENYSYALSEIMKVCDFCAVDLSDSYESNSELEKKLTSCSYVWAKYPCRIMLSYKDEAFFAESKGVLEKLKFDSFIVTDLK